MKRFFPALNPLEMRRETPSIKHILLAGLIGLGLLTTAQADMITFDAESGRKCNTN